MRDIKYRIWLENEEFMGEVVQITRVKDNIVEIKVKDTINGGWYYVYEDSKFSLMQYTGLKDKNGVEVYFDDIVEDDYRHRYEVVFEGDCLRCNGIRSKRNGYRPKNRWFSRDLEVIGNIHENPELLEDELNAIKQ